MKKNEKGEYIFDNGTLRNCRDCGKNFGKGSHNFYCDKCIIEQPTTETYMFFYGSLRAEGYNHGSIEKVADFKGYTAIKGFKLLSLGSYPCVVKSKNKNDKVIGEVFLINDIDVIKRIDNMELSAGYKRARQKVIMGSDDKVEVLFYEFKKSVIAPIVESGDWVKEMNQRKKNMEMIKNEKRKS